MVKEEKSVAKVILSLLLLVLPLTVKANNIEIFYNGFWSHSPFPMTIERLRKTYSLHISVHKFSIPEVHINILEDDFQESEDLSLDIDYVFYLVETNSEGKVVKELAGNNNVLFDLTKNTYKQLSEKEKRLLNNYIKDLSCEKSDFLPYKKV